MSSRMFRAVLFCSVLFCSVLMFLPGWLLPTSQGAYCTLGFLRAALTQIETAAGLVRMPILGHCCPGLPPHRLTAPLPLASTADGQCQHKMLAKEPATFMGSILQSNPYLCRCAIPSPVLKTNASQAAPRMLPLTLAPYISYPFTRCEGPENMPQTGATSQATAVTLKTVTKGVISSSRSLRVGSAPF
jgi:hypothetical protein